MAYSRACRLLSLPLAVCSTGCVRLGPLDFTEEDPVVETICGQEGTFEFSNGSPDPSHEFHTNAGFFQAVAPADLLSDFGLDPESEQDVADFEFVFGSRSLILWIQLGPRDREAGDPRETLTAAMFGVAEGEVEDTQFPILDTSGLGAALAEGAPALIATRFREFAAEAREFGHPFSVLAHCTASDNPLTCPWSGHASHSTGGSILVGEEYDRRVEPSAEMAEAFLSNDIHGSARWEDGSTVEFTASCMHLQ